jgi:hypothetical protein
MLAHRAGKEDVMGESDFEFALRLLKAGKRVAREGWNGKGQWIAMMPVDSQPYIALWNAQCKWQPGWVPSSDDLFAEDWVEIEQQ